MKGAGISDAGPLFGLRFDLARAFLAVTLTRKRFLRPAFFTGLQVEGMPLDLFYDIFLLNFTLETT